MSFGYFMVENGDGQFVAAFATCMLADLFVAEGGGCYRRREEGTPIATRTHDERSPLYAQTRAIADRVVPAYRAKGSHYSCTGHVAHRWQAAFDGAAAAMGVDFVLSSSTPAALAPAKIDGEGEALRLAYKTGHTEGYIDATDDGTGNGYCDHDAAEEGWQQYKEKLGAEAVHRHPTVPAHSADDISGNGCSAYAVRSERDTATALTPPTPSAGSGEGDPFDDCLGIHVQANARRLAYTPLPSPTASPEPSDTGMDALAYYHASTCACTAAERYVDDCPKHGFGATQDPRA